MLTAIALDDEIPALEVLESFAARTKTVELKATFSKTGEALRHLQKNKVDLLFLDINMPAMSGLDFAKAIDENIIIIFTTSYSEYAVEGFNLNAVDYLLKPFAYQRFLQAVEKAKTIHEARLSNPVEPLLLRANYGTVQILPGEILFIEGLDNYLKIYLTNNKNLVVRMPMKDMMKLLPNDQFIRVHRSYIISVAKVDFVRSKAIFIENNEIPLGGKYEEAFLEVFQPRS